MAMARLASAMAYRETQQRSEKKKKKNSNNALPSWHESSGNVAWRKIAAANSWRSKQQQARQRYDSVAIA